MMGGYQIESHGSGDDGFNEEGYDESQRAEILEFTRDGPSDGTIIIDLDPDTEADRNDSGSGDELLMEDDEIGTEARVDSSDEDRDEDEVQADFDDGAESDDDDSLGDDDDSALKP